MRLVDADKIEPHEQFEALGNGKYEFVRVAYMDDIDALPTVDTVPVRRGRWIDIDSETYTWKIRCSKCGHERSMMSTGQTYPMYCEDCGARMDGKESNG